MKKSIAYKVFTVINTIIMILIVLVTLYPFINIIARSFSTETAVLSGEVSVWPKGWNVDAYKMVIYTPLFARGYFNTILYTFIAVVVCLFMTAICAYPLSKKDLPGRAILVKFIMFTMFFGGGMIPNFLLVKTLHMIDTVWAITLPGAIGVWNVLIMITFFQGLPESLEEAGRVDGLSTIGVLRHIVVPLSKPIFATMVLFFAVGQWNNWFGPLIYFNSNEKYPITLFLRNILMSAQNLSTSASDINFMLTNQSIAPSESLKAATIVLVTTPILVLYPFVQKYFVKGMLIGSVKG